MSSTLEEILNVIAISNQKGGVAKTTTTINLAAGLALKEYLINPENPKKVLFVSLDPQADGSLMMAGQIIMREDQEPKQYKYNLADLMMSDDPPSTFEAIQKSILPSAIKGCENLDFIPTDRDSMSALNTSIIQINSREERLKYALEDIDGFYKYVIIDTPTRLDPLHLNALYAATHFIVPMVPTGLGLIHLQDLFQTTSRIQKRQNPGLKFMGILPSRCAMQRSETHQVLETLRENFPEKMFDPIADRSDVTMASTSGLDIFSYRSPRIGSTSFISESSDAAKEFGALTNRVYDLLNN